MSIRLEMLQLARLAPKALGEATGLVEAFLRRQAHPAGGFRDRAGDPDLYYSVFGLESLTALRLEPDWGRVVAYLETFGDGATLDFVHLGCLARCWANVQGGARTPVPAAVRAGVAAGLARFRSADGGYSVIPGSATGSAYGAFLAVASHQDVGQPLPEPGRLEGSLAALAAKDGGWANEPFVPEGGTNSSAAVVTVLRHLGRRVDPGAGDWLLRQWHPQGGFRAVPEAPIPDLLSTATALHALAGLQRDLAPVREPCLDFIDTLWTNEGGFHGHWSDDQVDVEYTFYGLLALGHLSVP